ncbi:MAG: biotin--[acetyl-CoA-carboxylase] ligase [Planctomycetota bacterium]|nr:biotin--[acetyl-CoA-carboxylase] ligase [Planctomycetota bacterium]
MTAPDETGRVRDAVGEILAREQRPARVVVLDETPSTQDVAREMARDLEGAWGVAIALAQTAGRGRLGRSWTASPGLSLACTIAIPAPALDPARLSLAAGVAAVRACEALLGTPNAVTRPPAPTAPDAPPAARLGLRWPNDVVERGPRGRKLSGVLIEMAGGAALVGVGINLRHTDADWPAELRGRAVSLRQLASRDDGPLVDVSAAACALVRAMSRVLREPFEHALDDWRACDVLTGTRRAFVRDGVRYEGMVRGVDPLSHLELDDDQRGLVRLDVLTTSMVHDVP